MSDSESFRSCSSEGSDEETSGYGDSQPGVGIQPFDFSLLDQATHRRRVRMGEPGQEGPVVDPTVLLEVPAILEVSVSGGQEVPVRVQGTPEETQDEVPRELVVEDVEQSAPDAAKVIFGEHEVPVLINGMETLAISEETLDTPEETEEPEAQGKVPAAHREEQSASVPASTDSMSFKREIPAALEGRESQVWTGPYSGFKERTWRVSVRDVACPVPGCPVITRHLREHALADHVSPMFESNFSRDVMANQGFHRFRGHMVILLARWLTGREDITSAEFVSWLQQRAAIPRGCKIQGMDMPPLRAVCQELNWERLSVYSLHPITSPVVILYWRVILGVLRFLGPTHRACVALDEYQGNNDPAYDILCQTNWRFCQVAEPVVAQSTTSVPDKEPTVQASSVALLPVTIIVQSAPYEREEKVTSEVQSAPQEKDERVTIPVEEPVAVATNSSESLVVLAFQNTRKLVAVTSVASAVAQARELFDLEDQEVVLTYLGEELTRSVRMELLPAMAELTVTFK